MSEQPAILTRLGYDGTDLKKGLADATADVQKYKAQAVLAQSDLARAKQKFSQEFSAASRRETQQRVSDLEKQLNAAMSSARKGAAARATAIQEQLTSERAVLAAFDSEKQKIQQLESEYTRLKSAARGAQAAKSIIAPQVKASRGTFEKDVSELSVGKVLQATGILGLGASIPFAIHKIGEALHDLATDAGEYAERIEQAAQKTGIAPKDVEKFDAVAHVVGLSSDDAVTAMRKFSEGMVALQSGVTLGTKGVEIEVGRAGSILKDLGVTAHETFPALLQIADAFHSMPDGALKSKLAIDLFGRSGLQLIPLLDKGSDGFKQYAEQFSDYLPDLKNATDEEETYRGEQEKLNLLMKELGVEIFPALVSGLQLFVQVAKDAVDLFTKGAVHPQSATDTLRALGITGLTGLDEKKFNDLIAEQKNAGGVIPLPTGGFAPTSIPDADAALLAQAQEEYSAKFPNSRHKASPEELAALAVSFSASGSGPELVPPKGKSARDRALENDILAESSGRSGAGRSSEKETAFQNEEARQEAEAIKEHARQLAESIRYAAEITKEIVGRNTTLPEIFKAANKSFLATLPNSLSGLGIGGPTNISEPGVSLIDVMQGFKEFGETVKNLKGLEGVRGQAIKADIGGSLTQLSQGIEITKAMTTLGGSLGQGILDVIRGGTHNGRRVTRAQRISGAGELLGGAVSDIQSIQAGPLSGAVGGSNLGGDIGGVIGSLAKVGSSLAKFAGPIGSIVGAGIGLIGGIFGGGKAAAKDTQNIKQAIDRATDALRNNTASLAQTIVALQAQRAQAVSQLSGSKAGKKQLNSLLPQLDQEIASLQGQQKQLLQSFGEKLGNLQVPVGIREYASTIQQINDELKQAAGAGATLTQQTQYLNAAMADLTRTLGDDLNNEEKNYLSLLQQDLSLQQQRIQIMTQAAQQEQNIRNSLSLGRAYTPAQSAAEQIRQLKVQTAQQLVPLDQQQKLIEAQIGDQGKLFGINVKNLDTQQAMNEVLAAQLEVQKHITDEVMAQISAQQDWYSQLANGKIPSLPAGSLPGGPGYGGLPTTFGGTVTVQPGAVVINTTETDAQKLADALNKAIGPAFVKLMHLSTAGVTP